MKALHLPVLLAALLLTACTETNIRPETQAAGQAPEAETDAAAQQQGAAETAKKGAADTAAGQAQPLSDAAATREDFERLESRFSLAQEQLLGLISQSAQTRELNQRLMLQLQSIQNLLGAGAAGNMEKADSNNGVTADGYDTAAMDAVLEQLLMVANDLGSAQTTATSPFALAITYVGAGNWKAIRYNQLTGESWLAKGNQWIALNDSELLPESSYVVSMTSGEDLLVSDERLHKGFIAARLDRVTGRMWWLNRDTWQLYSE
ncbi:MAG: hypothetical protein OIF57_10360 [Marinobacterium sp.]|nr:hypothetical protein [Marinobacterium sp.]